MVASRVSSCLAVSILLAETGSHTSAEMQEKPFLAPEGAFPLSCLRCCESLEFGLEYGRSWYGVHGNGTDSDLSCHAVLCGCPCPGMP